MGCKWFKLMVSVPRPVKPTLLARFHELSGVFVYLLLGLLCICAPVLVHYVFQMSLSRRAEAYIRLFGIELAIVGFDNFMTGRLNPQSTGAGHILASIPGRIILANFLFLSLLIQDLQPLSFVLFPIIGDTILATTTYVVWYKITDGATFGVFLKDICRPLLVRCLFDKSRGASVAVNAFGILQFMYAIFFAIRPQFAQEAFRLDPFHGDYHAAGFLGAFFCLVCQSAWHMIYMGKARSVAFNIGTVFYRLCFKIPLLVILVATNQIEVGLSVFLIVIDGAYAAITLMLLYLSGLDEDEAPSPEETDAIIPKGEGDKGNKGEPDFTPPE